MAPRFPGFMRYVMALLLLVCHFWVAGCGGNDDGDDREQTGPDDQAAVITDAAVTAEMQWVASVVPGCEVEMTDIIAGWMREGPVDAPAGALSGLVAVLAASKSRLNVYVPAIALMPLEVEGDCGGRLAVSSTPSGEETTWVLKFQDFCIPMETGGQPEALTLSGRIRVRRMQAPGSPGVLTTGYGADTDGPLTVSDGRETVSLSLNNFTYTLGVPGTSIGAADADHPDVIILERLAAAFASNQREWMLAGLKAFAHASGEDILGDIVSGRLHLGGRGYVEIITRRPLALNNRKLVSGTLEMKGAKGDRVSLTIGDDPGEFLPAINGEPLDHCMVCKGFDFLGMELPF